jgi:predicted nucleic acid-binding protein
MRALILKIAMKEGLTYYDASYIQAAIANGFTLSQTMNNSIKQLGSM